MPNDLLAFASADSRGTNALADPVLVADGDDLLGQRFLLELYREKGVDLYGGDRGCRFLTAARNGLLSTESDVFSQFSLAMLDVSRNLRADEDPSDPSATRFASAEIFSVLVNPGSLSLVVRVRSLAKATSEVTVTLPA